MNKGHPLYLGALCVLAALLGLLILSPTHAQTNADTAEPVWPTATPLPTQEGTPFPPIDSPLPTPTATPVISPLAQVALDYLVEQTGAAREALLLENEHPRSYPLLGREFMAFNIFNTETAESFILLVDLQTKEVVELAVMEEANAHAHVAKYGKLHPLLYERLQTVDDATELPIGVWVVSDWSKLYESLVDELSALHPEVAEAVARGNMPFDVGDPALSKELRKEWSVLLQRELDATLSPLITALEADKVEFEQQIGTPSLVASLTKAQIEALSKRDDVRMLFLVDGKPVPALDTAVPTDRVPSVWSRWIDGTGRTIAVVEEGNVDPDSAYLNVSANVRAGCLGEQNHATWVAHAAAGRQFANGTSTLNPYRGVASGATILSAGVSPCSEAAIYPALQWAIAQGADVVNVSYGMPRNTPDLEWNDVQFDYEARAQGATIIVAAGNRRDEYVKSPGKAWNVITVGGTNNRDTAAWHDDDMYDIAGTTEASSYRNPGGGTGGDREKPEVAAPAQEIRTRSLDDVPALVSGTSFAAPQVAGLAAVMMQHNSALTDYPMAIKAIVMATAIHNVEGDPRLSDHDGAGSIDAALADYVAQVRGTNGTVCARPCWWAIDTTESNPAVGADNVQTFRANRGERVRAVIAWWSRSGSLPYPVIALDRVDTNFDLRVYGPGGNQVAASTSVDNNYEIVDFVAPGTGTYTIRVRKASAAEPTNTLAIAWVNMGTYLPDVRINDGWTSTIYVRNDGHFEMDARVTFFDQSGAFSSEVLEPDLQPNEVRPVTTLLSNWRGTAIVTGNDDVSVVVREEKTGMATLDNGYATGGATDIAWGQAATTLFAPGLFNNIYGGYFSELSFSHTSAASANATFNLLGRSGYGNYVANYIMGPNNQQVIPLSTLFGSSSWVGSLHMTSDQPVFLRLFDGAGSSNGRSYNATAVGCTLIFVPAAYRAYGGFTTAIYIQNLSSTASTNVTLRYCASQVTDPASCPTTGPTAIAPRTAIGVNLAAAPVPDGWAGSVSIQSSGSVPISAVFSNGNAEDAYSVSATGYGSKLIILPRAAKNASGRTTGFTIRNVSGQNNVNVVARYYANNGALTWTRPTIVLNSAQVFGAYQSLDSGIPAGWEGSIVLEASHDIIAILREETTTTLAAYNGVSR